MEKQIEITLPNNEKKKFALPTTGLQILQDEYFRKFENIVGLKMNQQILNLHKQIDLKKASIEVIEAQSIEGQKMLNDSIIFILAMAIWELYPKTRLFVEHDVSNGYFCTLHNMQADESALKNIKSKMCEIMSKDLPIYEKYLSLEEAMEFFKDFPQTHSLIRTLNRAFIKFNECNGFMDIHLNPLVSHTKISCDFDLTISKHGFILSHPFNKFIFHEKFFEAFDCHNTWGKRMNINCIGDINDIVLKDEMRYFILVNESAQNYRIATIASQIHERYLKENCKLILIAGPSSSGKTTFSKKLSMHLEILGLKPIVLSVDDYYKPRVECPKDENGQYDFEVLEALRVDLLNEHLSDLLKGKEIEKPIFDFYSGWPKEKAEKIKLEENSVIIMEGIFCLNDKLTPKVDKKYKYKIFICPFAHIKINETHSIPHTLTRLLRMINRDYNTRGYSVIQTLDRWQTVRRGEDKNIMPCVANADTIFNSSLDYEFNLLKTYVKPILEQVPVNSRHYEFVRQLISFLGYFKYIQADYVPSDSLLREFVGGNIFDELAKKKKKK